MNVKNDRASSPEARQGFQSTPPRLLPMRLALIALIGCISSLTAQENTAQPPKKSFAEIRADAIRSIDSDFLKEEGFSEERTSLFIRTRLAAEDEVIEDARKTGKQVTMKAVTYETEVALTRAFNAELAQRYREAADTQLGWLIINNTPSLKDADWLTTQEKERLARAWGPIIAEVMDVTLAPNFEPTATAQQKHAIAKRMKANYLKKASDILGASKLAQLESVLSNL